MLAPAAIALALLLAPSVPPAGEVRVTYLANEGVHIAGSCSVLVDTLLRDSLGRYARHAPTNFARLLAAGPVDVALVPFWWLLEPPGTTFVKDRWKPRHVIAFHVGDDDRAQVERVLANTPDAWAPVRAGESRLFRKRE